MNATEILLALANGETVINKLIDSKIFMRDGIINYSNISDGAVNAAPTLLNQFYKGGEK